MAEPSVPASPAEPAGPAAWRNWSGAVVCTPRALRRAASEAEVVACVREAGRTGAPVRPVGTGHSSSPLVATDGFVLSLDDLAGIADHDAGRAEATLRAGTKLHALGEALHPLGLALENLGDVDVQSVAGALATGTHGTGRTLGNLASRVVALRVVLASGDVVTWSEADDPERLRAARVSLGALGIVVTARLRLVPSFRLHERVRRMPLPACLETLDAEIASHRHFEFFWYPSKDLAETKAIDPVGEPPALGRYERSDWSHRILPSVREERFHEMEYALPAEAGRDAFLALRERIRSRHPDLLWPVEYRTVAADDAWLSPASGRATVALSVHQDGRLPFRELFADLEPILVAHGGRPHWGKVHTQTAATLRDRYPRFDDFRALRAALDPQGRFLNDHLRRVLDAPG